MAIIAVDFDGTCVSHAFPDIGKDIGAVPILKKLVENGHQLVLFTMRSNVEDVDSPELPGKYTGNYLEDAINWFKKNNIPLYGINTNPKQKYWTSSPKAYADYYIDDSALGCPLIYDEELSDKSFVDWNAIESSLKYLNLI